MEEFKPETKTENKELNEKIKLKSIALDLENPNSVLFNIDKLSHNIKNPLIRLGLSPEIEGNCISVLPALKKIFEEKMDEIISTNTLDEITYSAEKIAQEYYADHKPWHISQGEGEKPTVIHNNERTTEKYFFDPEAENVLKQLIINKNMVLENIDKVPHENFLDLLAFNLTALIVNFEILIDLAKKYNIENPLTITENEIETDEIAKKLILRRNAISQYGKIISCLLLAGQKINESIA